MNAITGRCRELNKSETAQKFGEAQVKLWRRSYDVPPPTLELTDERHPKFDPRYASLTPKQLPPLLIAEDHSQHVASLLAFDVADDQIRQARARCRTWKQFACNRQVPLDNIWARKSLN